MAHYHVYASVIRKGKIEGGAAGFADYIERRTPGQATQAQRYIAREGHERDDLVASGSAGLPQWANGSPEHFWAMADTYTRGGPKRPGVVARHYQFTLPRELSSAARRDLADDLRDAFFAKYAHSWAIHCPPARDGSGDNPHLHVLFSPRRDDLDRTCGPKQWFSKAAERGKDPLSGGVRMDRMWDAKRTLQGIRHESATLINAALEREGVGLAVTPRQLRDHGIERRGLHYHAFGKAAHQAPLKEGQDALRWANHPWEAARYLDAWQAQKAREGLRDLSREAAIDHVRDRFWRHDHSPAREQERQESLLRAIDREYARTGRERGLPVDRTQERVRAQEPARLPSRARCREVAWQRGLDLDDTMRGGVQVQLDDREHEWLR